MIDPLGDYLNLLEVAKRLTGINGNVASDRDTGEVDYGQDSVGRPQLKNIFTKIAALLLTRIGRLMYGEFKPHEVTSDIMQIQGQTISPFGNNKY